jgi:hypothetical protein
VAGSAGEILDSATIPTSRNRGRAALAKGLEPIYAVASEAEALERFAEFGENGRLALPGDHQAVGERLGRRGAGVG